MTPESIVEKLNNLQKLYENKLYNAENMVPISIRKDALNSISKSMDKLENKLNSMGYEWILPMNSGGYLKKIN
jgi:hypothetical protein